MPNEILNASGLDGVAGFANLEAIDSTVIGAPGRRVHVAPLNVTTSFRPLNGKAGVYAFSHHNGTRLVVRFATATGVAVGDRVLPLISNERRGSAPVRGIAATFKFSRGYVTAPPTATQWGIFTDGDSYGIMFRPYGAAANPTDPRPCAWTPGPHLNPDLAIPSWPELLPYPQSESLEIEPIPLRKSFAGDDGTPTTRRFTSRSRYFCRFDLALDAIGRDLLEQFWRSNVEEFFFVRPDTGDLCLAEWADDGDPADSGGKPGSRRTTVRLLLREA